MTLIPPRRALLGAALAAPWLRGAAAQRREFRLSTVANRPVPLADGAFRWAELIGERSGGRITVRVHPGSALVGGDQTRELLAMRQGVIDFASFSTINLAPQIREMNLFTLPWLLRDYRGFDAIIGGVVGQRLFRLLEARDVVPLAWGENGFRELSNSRRAVAQPADLRGLRIRFAAGTIFQDIYAALGANPLQMSFADLQPALATGAVDGQENPINLFLAFRMDQLAQRHMTVWHYCADAGILAVSRAVWEGLSAADRAIVADSAREAAAVQIAGSRRGIGIGGDRAAFAELATRGVAVVELDEAAKAVFARATRPVFERWVPRIGADLVREAEAAIARARG